MRLPVVDINGFNRVCGPGHLRNSRQHSRSEMAILHVILTVDLPELGNNVFNHSRLATTIGAAH